MGYSCN